MKATFDEKSEMVEILFNEAQQKAYLPFMLEEYLMDGDVFGLDGFALPDKLIMTAKDKDEYIYILEMVLQGI